MLAGEHFDSQLHRDLVSTLVGDTFVLDGLEFNKVHSLLTVSVVQQAAVESNVIEVNLTVAGDTNLNNEGGVLDDNVDVTLNPVPCDSLFEW